MHIIENSPQRLRIEFREECTAQLALGVVFAIAALLSLGLVLAGSGVEGWFFLALSTVVAVYSLAEQVPYACLVDHATGQFTIFRRNSLGQSQPLTYPIRDIDTLAVTRNRGRGRPCSTDVCLKSGQRSRLMSYQSCAVQHQVAERLTDFLRF